jgi:hypothetical protein
LFCQRNHAAVALLAVASAGATFSCEHPYEGLFGGALRAFAALPEFVARALICR